MKHWLAWMISGFSLLDGAWGCPGLSAGPIPWHQPGSGTLRHVEVVFLLGADCPISRQYIPFLRTVRERWQPYGLRSVSIVFCNPARQEKRMLARKFMSELGVRLPWKTDHGNRYAHRMGATVVPAVLVFQSAKQVYSGAIDDMFAGLGQRRAFATEHYLAEALEACRTGRMPSPSHRNAYGCLIE